MADTSLEWVQVSGGEIVETDLPEGGELSDGTSVSNYHLLDDATLRKEGWQVVDDPGEPPMNTALHAAAIRDVVVRNGKAVAEYRLLPAEPSYVVDGPLVRVYAFAFDTINFHVGGQHGQHVPVSTTDGIAELLIQPDGGGSGIVPVWIAELEQEAEVSV